MDLHPQDLAKNARFITDAKGKAISAIIPIKHCAEVMEILEDLADGELIENRRNEPAIPWEQAKRELGIRVRNSKATKKA
jgi:hypothetical protein